MRAIDTAAEREGGGDHDVEPLQRPRTDAPRHDGGDRPTRRAPPRPATSRPGRRSGRSRSADRRSRPTRRGGRSARRTPSTTPSGGSGGEPKWSRSLRMLPGSLTSWSTTGGTHSTTPSTAVRRSGACRRSWRPAPSDVTERAERQHAGRHEVRHVGLRAQRPGDDHRHEHRARRRSSTAQAASSTTIHASSGRYGFHGWVSRSWPVAADRQRRARAPTADHAAPTGPALADPQGGGDRARGGTTIAAACSAHEVEPSSRYVGASR